MTRSQSSNQLPNYPTTQLLNPHPYDTRPPSSIGRAARLELSFERRRGRTILAHSYAEPPFRVGRAFEVDGAAYVIIVCTGAGIFAGDTLRQSIRVGEGARVVLTSQSALQIHPSSATAPAAVHHRYIVENEGELQCQWDAVIPFAAARLEQRFDLQLADSSRLYWSDALMAGRISRGEAWQFDSLAHELSLRVGGSLAYMERYRLTPHDRTVEQPWIAGRARYLATVVACHERATEAAAGVLHRQASEASEPGRVDAAFDLIRPRTIVGRLLAADGAPFSAARSACHAFSLASIFGGAGGPARK